MIWSVAIAKQQVKFVLYDKILNKRAAFYSDESEVPTDFYKRRYEVRSEDDPFEPGDIVAFKPIGRWNEWTEEERNEFLIVIVVGTDFRQMEEGMVEPLYGVKKRRMNLPLDIAEQGKVIPITRCFDKLKNRNIMDSDKLRKME